MLRRLSLTLRFALLAAIPAMSGSTGCTTDKTDDSDAPTSSARPKASSSAPHGTSSAPPPPVFDATFEEDAGVPTPDPGDACIDKDDVGSSESTAKALPNINDCD